MGLLDSIPKDQILRGIIIRVEKGHALYTTFNDDQLKIEELRKKLMKVGANIIINEMRGSREDFRNKIKELNNIYNLPGVKPLELITECC